MGINVVALRLRGSAPESGARESYGPEKRHDARSVGVIAISCLRNKAHFRPGARSTGGYEQTRSRGASRLPLIAVHSAGAGAVYHSRFMPTFFIKTYGCQMNERDSEQVAYSLVERGYERVQHETEADVILLNTCSVRDMADQKAL